MHTSRWYRTLHFLTAYCLLLTAFCSLHTSCGARRTPNLERIFAPARERSGKRPVIVVPGILGSQLVNRETGEVVWPSVFRSRTDELSLPTTPDLKANRDNLIATRIVDTAKFAERLPIEVYIYYELLDALKRFGGYQEGSWDNPPADGDRDTFYVFAYDWRHDNVESARELIRRIEELKRRLNRPELRFDIVAHSMGGLVARYAAMYGDVDLPQPPATLPITWAGAGSINKILMFGTPNGGATEAFATLLDGYFVTEGLRRRVRLLGKLSREDAFTIPSIFQLLPHRATARFLDENLQPLTIDLYDPAVWRRYGWAIINEERYRKRFASDDVGRKDGESQPADQARRLADLDAYFAATLKRAEAFHAALDAVAGVEQLPVPLYAFGGDCEETLSAAIILPDQKRSGFITLTTPRAFRNRAGQRVSKAEATRLMYEPGDGRVTRRSVLGEGITATANQSTLLNSSLPLTYSVFACDLHSELQNNRTLQDNALTLLVREVMK